jgi:ubiquinone/menaquinone biosynthesis C-methylase UbiE
MSEQKQHVEIHRKLGLRRELIEKAPKLPGAFFIPFIGDGDIAAELYSGHQIYGADIDANRVKTATARLPKSDVVEADCDKYPFPDVKEEFSLADFDSYSYPYDSFREFWKVAKTKSPLVLFFTDGQLQAINRTGHWRHPDGSKQNSKTLTERRQVANKYFTGTIFPWFTEYIKPWTITHTQKYKRGQMLYWGSVIEKPDTDTVPVKSIFGTGKIGRRCDKFDAVKKEQYLASLRSGIGRTLAADKTGVSRQTLSNHRTRYPAFAEDESLAETHADEKVENALYEAAVSGNVTAIQVWLYNRQPGKWADRRSVKQELYVPDGINVKFANELSDADLERIAATGSPRALKAAQGTP